MNIGAGDPGVLSPVIVLPLPSNIVLESFVFDPELLLKLKLL